MKIFIYWVFLFSLSANANTQPETPAGNWEGFQKSGMFNYSLIVSINENNTGFYGIYLGGKNSSICFPIDKSTLKQRDGYFEQINNENNNKFVLLFTEGLNSLEAISIAVYDKNTVFLPLTWSLVSTKEKFINIELKAYCEKKLKNHT